MDLRKRSVEAVADADIDEPSMGSKDNATAAISALCAEHGVWAVRVHDVAKSRDAVAIGNVALSPTSDTRGGCIRLRS